MPKFPILFGLSLFIFAGACTHYGVDRVEQGDNAPTGLYFPHVPKAAHITVDGVDRGLAGAFTGSKKDILSTGAGTHRVVVSIDGQILFEKPVYVGAGSRVRIDLN